MKNSSIQKKTLIGVVFLSIAGFVVVIGANLLKTDESVSPIAPAKIKAQSKTYSKVVEIAYSEPTVIVPTTILDVIPPENEDGSLINEEDKFKEALTPHDINVVVTPPLDGYEGKGVIIEDEKIIENPTSAPAPKLPEAGSWVNFLPMIVLSFSLIAIAFIL